MQIPFIVLSYGVFQKSKKLFSYERDGIHVLPVFTDMARATKFAQEMSQILRYHFRDKRNLQTQICGDPKMALQMFETITAYCPDLMQVIIDPRPPVRDNEEQIDIKNLSLIEHLQDIDDVLEQLQDWASTDEEIGEAGGDGSESNGSNELPSS